MPFLRDSTGFVSTAVDLVLTFSFVELSRLNLVIFPLPFEAPAGADLLLSRFGEGLEGVPRGVHALEDGKLGGVLGGDCAPDMGSILNCDTEFFTGTLMGSFEEWGGEIIDEISTRTDDTVDAGGLFICGQNHVVGLEVSSKSINTLSVVMSPDFFE